MKILDIAQFEKLNINEITISDLNSVSYEEFIAKKPDDFKFHDIFPGFIFYVKSIEQPFIVVDLKSYEAFGYATPGKYSISNLFAATVVISKKLKYIKGIPQREKLIIAYNFDDAYSNTWPNDNEETFHEYDVVKVYVPENLKVSFANKKEFFNYFEYVKDNTNKN